MNSKQKKTPISQEKIFKIMFGVTIVVSSVFLVKNILEKNMTGSILVGASILIFAVILFTILFWCACSVALSWKDTANIKAIAFEKTKSETIINVLSGIAYFLTALVLFV